jgi:autotransporter-associated beta strand protein
VELNAGQDKTLSRILTGSGGLIKTGTGTLTLSGANNYSGGTIITAGTLAVTGTLGGGNYAGNIANAGTLLFNQNGLQTLSGVISGSGGLSKAGTGVLTLTGANIYTGMTTVRAGTLELGASGSLASHDLTLHGALFSRTTAAAAILWTTALSPCGERTPPMTGT